MTIESLKSVYTVTEGFENRLKSYINEATDFHHLIRSLKAKRYTYIHIQRLSMNVSLDIKPTGVTRNTHAVKVLAINDCDRQYLKYLKTAFPERRYITNINKSNVHYLTNEIKATHTYNVINGRQRTDLNTSVIQ